MKTASAQPYDRTGEGSAVVYHQHPEDSLESMGMMNLLSLPTSSDFNLGFENDLNGWTTHGSVNISEYTSIQADNNNWEVWPKNSKMAVLVPLELSVTSDDAFSQVAAILQISDSSKTYFNSYFANPTTFAYIYKDVALTANQIYYVAWNYVATDYAPFNDASFFTLANTTNPMLQLP